MFRYSGSLWKFMKKVSSLIGDISNMMEYLGCHLYRLRKALIQELIPFSSFNFSQLCLASAPVKALTDALGIRGQSNKS